MLERSQPASRKETNARLDLQVEGVLGAVPRLPV